MRPSRAVAPLWLLFELSAPEVHFWSCLALLCRRPRVAVHLNLRVEESHKYYLSAAATRSHMNIYRSPSVTIAASRPLPVRSCCCARGRRQAIGTFSHRCPVNEPQQSSHTRFRPLQADAGHRESGLFLWSRRSASVFLLSFFFFGGFCCCDILSLKLVGEPVEFGAGFVRDPGQTLFTAWVVFFLLGVVFSFPHLQRLFPAAGAPRFRWLSRHYVIMCAYIHTCMHTS